MSTTTEPAWWRESEYAAEIEANPELQGMIERIARDIQEHIVKGNTPDYEAANRIRLEILADYATLRPTGRTEDEARELVARHCPKRSFFR